MMRMNGTLKKYKNKEMFSSLWSKDYIIPIWNNKNFDEVCLEVGLIDRIPSHKEKGVVYAKVFRATDKDNIQRIKELRDLFKKSRNTNLDKLIDYCLKQAGESN